MKKICVVILMLLLTQIKVKANVDYQNYESMEVYGGVLLRDFTDEDYDKGYSKLANAKIFGWNIHMMNENIRVKYVTETVFSYYNKGTTPIKYETTLVKNITSKQNISASGSIGIQVKGDIKKFKGQLDSALKISYDNQKIEDIKETTKMTFEVDPDTQVILKICGEGRISNGVAKKYFFFLTTQQGGFEVFDITSQYQRLEKIKV